jgi:hypothetical protein
MRNQTVRPIVALVSILLISGTPAHAVPVVISEVRQVFGGALRNPPELKLRSLSQNSSVLASSFKGPLTSYRRNEVPDTLTDPTPGRGAAGSLLSGIVVSSSEQQVVIDTTAQGDVQGTICDCGEIFIVGGGFPKWPFLFLAAVPLFFIDRGDHPETPASTPTPIALTSTPTPTPQPPPTPNVPVPEPSSVLFLSTALLALVGGLRRRRKAKSVVEIENRRVT